jgi:large subunit ribosomal protein L18
MIHKKSARLRRGRRGRARIRVREGARLCVFRSPRHIYAQVIDDRSGRVVASASTLESEIKSEISTGGNVSAATVVGRRIAQKASAAGVSRVMFDRAGYKYHGRVKALADAAREGGLSF